MAIAEDKVFLPTSDAHMVALSAVNGQILWDRPVSDKPHRSTGGAIVIGDKVLMGLTGCARCDGEGCYISAFDIHTGQRAWRFYTIRAKDSPGAICQRTIAPARKRGWRAAMIPNSTSRNGASRSRSHGIS